MFLFVSNVLVASLAKISFTVAAPAVVVFDTDDFDLTSSTMA
jgi:hypothetical protein